MALQVGELVALFKGDASGFMRDKDRVEREGRRFDGTRYTAVIDADSRPMVRQLRQAAGEADRATEDVAKRANAKFSAIQFAAMFAGVPAAAAAAGLAAGGILAGAALAFGAVGLSGVQSSYDVTEAWQSTARDISNDFRNASGVMEITAMQALDKVHASADRMGRSWGSAFEASREPLLTATSGVLNLAENALPGLLRAVDASQAPMDGLGTLLSETGMGANEMFTNMSTGAEGAGQIMGTTGGIIRNLESFVGSLVATLATEGDPAVRNFAGGLAVAEENLLTVAHNGMPMLTGATQGVTTTLSGAITLIGGVAQGLGSWAAPAGQAAGSLYATNTILKLFGSSLSETGFGFKALATHTDAAGNKTSAYKQAVEGAHGGTAKLNAGVGALVSGGFNPLGFAAIAAGVGLSILGQHQQDVANATAAHKQNVGALADALRESNGVIDSNVQALAAKELANFRVGDGERNLLQDVQRMAGADGVRLLTEAYMGNRGAGEQLVGMLQNQKTAYGDSALIQSVMGKTQAETAGIIQGQVLPVYQDAITRNEQMAAATRNVAAQMPVMSDSQRAASVSTGILSEGFEKLADTESDAEEKGSALHRMLDLLNGRIPTSEESQQRLDDSMRKVGESFKEADFKVHGFGDALVHADGTADTFSENGSDLQNFLVNAAEDFGKLAEAWRGAGVPADEINQRLSFQRDRIAETLKGYGLTPAAIQKVIDKYGLVPKEVSTLATLDGGAVSSQVQGVLDELQRVPPEQGVEVEVLDAEAQRKLIDLGQTVVALPNGTFQVFADTTEGRAEAKHFASEWDGRVVTADMLANTAPAAKKVSAWLSSVEDTPAEARFFADSGEADTAVDDWRERADNALAEGAFWADTEQAEKKVREWVAHTNVVTAQGSFFAEDGAAEKTIREWEARADEAKSEGSFYAETAEAYAKVSAWSFWSDAISSEGSFGADASEADAKVSAWSFWSDQIRTEGSFWAESEEADKTVREWQLRADQIIAEGSFWADNSEAEKATREWEARANAATATGRIYGDISNAMALWNAWTPVPKTGLLSAVFGYAAGGRVQGFADGGLPGFPHGGKFSGAGGPRDDANIIAISDAEFISNAVATDRWETVLTAMNAGASVQQVAGLVGAMATPQPAAMSAGAPSGGSSMRGSSIQVEVSRQIAPLVAAIQQLASRPVVVPVNVDGREIARANANGKLGNRRL